MKLDERTREGRVLVERNEREAFNRRIGEMQARLSAMADEHHRLVRDAWVQVDGLRQENAELRARIRELEAKLHSPEAHTSPVLEPAFDPTSLPPTKVNGAVR